MADTFRCVPLRCVLTRAACVRRHEHAQQRPSQLGPCQGCNVGAAHARGEPTPATFSSERPVFDVHALRRRNFGAAQCPGCSKMFVRRTGNHDYCAKACAKRHSRFRRSLRVVNAILTKARFNHGLSPAEFLRKAGIRVRDEAP